MSFVSTICKMEHAIVRLVPVSLASLLLRIAVAVPFYRSGLTKWDGFGRISESALLLFSEEFKLHLLGSVYDYPMPMLAAYGAGLGEILLPILLVFGIGTRFAAFALLMMTAIIQVTVPTGWPLHLTWAAMALGTIALGPGRLSVDHVLRQIFGIAPDAPNKGRGAT